MKGALLVCGTHSDAGKSVIVAGMCRWLHRCGVRVAPFKAQNMALNSVVTDTATRSAVRKRSRPRRLASSRKQR